MLNVIIAERMKLKKNRMLLVCTAVDILIPILLILKDYIEFRDGVRIPSITDWVFGEVFIVQLIAYSSLSGFVITFLMQKEYSDQTIINCLAAPVDRIKFLSGKLIIWALWHIALAVGFLFITYFGVILLYGNPMLSQNAYPIAVLILKAGILNLAALMPVSWVTVVQRNAFYPSLLLCILFTAIGIGGLYWPVFWSSIFPWSAVTLLCVSGFITGNTTTGIMPFVSIALCGIIGFTLASYSFKKQEL